MSNCNNCGKSILFGGRKADGRTYCSANCLRAHPLLMAGDRVPADVLQQVVAQWRQGDCPKCKRKNGPIDVHAEHRVHSFLIMTQWHTRRHVSCRPCGRRAQLTGTLYSVALGWWGLPWGLLVTPMQIVRNIAGMTSGRPDRASPDFERLVRRQLAERQLEIEQGTESFAAQR